jgi:hypothetical protein
VIITTKNLELPGITKLTGPRKGIPTRPTAEMLLVYDERIDSVICRVREGDQENNTLKWDGQRLQIMTMKYEPKAQQALPVWRDWNVMQHTKNETETACWMLLLMSDVFCPNQARADFAQAIQSTFWQELLLEMSLLQAVASIMLT